MEAAARPGSGRASAAFWCALGAGLATLAALQLGLKDMPVTGDEPGYVYKALSFWRTGGFHLPPSAFGQAMPQFQALVASGADLGAGHPVAMSVVAAPLVGVFGVAGARAYSLLCAFAGIAAMAVLLRPAFGERLALVAVALMAFTFPILPYTHLFYPEMTLMMLVVSSWALGRKGGRRDAVLAVLCALLLPFVHIRAALLAPVLVAFAAWPLWRARDWPALAATAALCAVGAGLFVVQQYALFGKLMAGASAVFAPSLGGALPRLAVQLLEFRHGLLIVNPACILAIAGLMLGLLRRSPLAVQAAVLLLVYLPTMIWGAASESWPARFWTPVTPAMAVGLGVWLTCVRGAPARIAGGVLAAAALLNSVILLGANGSFLDNRMGDLSDDAYSPLHNHFDIAGLLPWDSFDFSLWGIDPAPALDERLLVTAALFCGLLVLAFVINGAVRSHRAAAWTTWLPGAALLPLLVAGAMTPTAASAVTVDRGAQSVVLTLGCPAPVRLIRIVTPMRPLMVPPTYPSGLDVVAARGDGGTESWRAPFSPIVGIPGGTVRAIQLTAAGAGAGGAWRQATFVALTAGLQSLRC